MKPVLFTVPDSIRTGKEIVTYFLENEISVHPFFSNPDRKNPGYIKLILENGRELDITRFLARTISMSSDLRIRCALVPQLYDELGKGDAGALHVFQIKKLLDALEPYTRNMSPEETRTLEKAYAELGALYTRLFFSDEYYTCLGVAIANELVVQPIFEYIKATVFADVTRFSADDIRWVTAHDELEEDHVGDTVKLAGFIPENGPEVQTAFRAGYDLLTGIERFFDELDRINLN